MFKSNYSLRLFPLSKEHKLCLTLIAKQYVSGYCVLVTQQQARKNVMQINDNTYLKRDLK